jgi:hypothetical protein
MMFRLWGLCRCELSGCERGATDGWRLTEDDQDEPITTTMLKRNGFSKYESEVYAVGFLMQLTLAFATPVVVFSACGHS